ncbi:hypothetical protein TRSC58_07276 [Trypanosoma rangeli SC58]|uniref:Uncharacterized protein n=1 Tax=Trypanosoma rangeli SC58 TaxID=429131 RepID=A0A061ITL8_TRYRA|nr:hypothetical protein TRSC58_07276 [Trypanosoma rangeli SC58]
MCSEAKDKKKKRRGNGKKSSLPDTSFTCHFTSLTWKVLVVAVVAVVSSRGRRVSSPVTASNAFFHPFTPFAKKLILRKQLTRDRSNDAKQKMGKAERKRKRAIEREKKNFFP